MIWLHFQGIVEHRCRCSLTRCRNWMTFENWVRATITHQCDSDVRRLKREYDRLHPVRVASEADIEVGDEEKKDQADEQQAREQAFADMDRVNHEKKERVEAMDMGIVYVVDGREVLIDDDMSFRALIDEEHVTDAHVVDLIVNEGRLTPAQIRSMNNDGQQGHLNGNDQGNLNLNGNLNGDQGNLNLNENGVNLNENGVPPPQGQGGDGVPPPAVNHLDANQDQLDVRADHRVDRRMV
eukprot:728549_1